MRQSGRDINDQDLLPQQHLQYSKKRNEKGGNAR